MATDPDDLDGCAAVADGTPTSDLLVDLVALFAGIDPEDDDAAALRAAEWQELFNAGHETG